MGTLGASLRGDILSKSLLKGKGVVRADEGIKKTKNEPKFNGVYSRDNLPKKTNNGAYVINLDEYADVGTHWIALHVKNNEII